MGRIRALVRNTSPARRRRGSFGDERALNDGQRRKILILDASARQVLAACRELGRLGHVVETAGYRDIELAGYSRYSARYHRLPDPRTQGAAFADALLNLIRSQGHELVVPSDDATILRVATIDLPVPTIPVADRAWDVLADKIELGRICGEVGVAYPPTFAPTTEADDDAAIRACGPSVVVKALRSALVAGDRVNAHGGAVITEDPALARQALAEVRRKGMPALVQARIRRSDKVNLTIFRREGNTEMRFVYRVVRDVPLTGGIAMAAETISFSEGYGAEALRALEDVFDAAGYEGLANAEFCVSAEDAKLYMIEVNARLWGSTWFAQQLGQRPVERAVRFALGEGPLPEVPYEPGRRFHHIPGELQWVWLHPRRRQALAELLRTTRPADVFEYQDGSDMGAVARYALLLASRRLRRRSS